MAANRSTVISILGKMKVECTDKIPLDRAKEKLLRAAKKSGLPTDVEWDEKETAALEEFGLLGASDDDAPEDDEEDEDSDDDSDEAEEDGETEDDEGDSDEDAEDEEEEAEDEEEPVKKEKKEKVKKEPKPKREGNIPLYKRLVAEGKTPEQIEAFFIARYKELGKDDTAWVKSRVGIYRSLATGEKKPKREKKVKEKKAKKGKDTPADAPAEKPADAPAADAPAAPATEGKKKKKSA